MSSLHQEIIFDILLQLPVKTLLRFRCVSKSLCNTIDSPDFIHAHLDSSIQTKIRYKLVLHRWKTDEVSDFYAADYRGVLKDPIKLKNSIKLPLHHTSIIGSCNGLILLRQNHKKLLLWNPFTTQYKVLIGQCWWYDAFGLGYDAVSYDYKVVRIPPLVSENHGVEIYSLSSNSWRRLEDFPYGNYEFDWNATGKFLDGTLYWLFEEIRNFKRIVAFDISTEKIHRIEIPFSGPLCQNQLHIVEGQLYLSSKYIDDDYKIKVNFYVSEKHEAAPRWRKLEGHATKNRRNFSFPKSLSYLKEEDKLLLDIELMNGIWNGSITCWESLVSLSNDNPHNETLIPLR